MAAPTITATATGTNAAGTSHAVTAPSGTANKVIAWSFTADPGAITPPSGWVFKKAVGAPQQRLHVFVKAATSDTAVNFTTANSVASAWMAFDTDGDIANAVYSTGVEASGTGIDPDSVAVTSGDYRVVVVIAIEDSRRNVTAYPTSYDDNQTHDSAGAGALPGIAMASRGLTAITSEDPAAFTLSGNVGKSTVTMAIPAAAGAGTQDLTGTLFSKAPTFPQGAVTPGTVTLTGTTFQKAPTFPTGTVSADADSQALTGSLFSKAPTFPQGTVTPGAVAITGSLFTKAPTFPTGAVDLGTRPVPTGLTTGEIGWLGHSNPGIFVDYYRSLSGVDLMPDMSQGGVTAEVWGDENHSSHDTAWAALATAAPVGGYRAMWVIVGYLASMDPGDFEGWADHIAAKIASDHPTVEYIWWSPQATYFTAADDGDAADLVALDPWDTNPTGLSIHIADDQIAEWSWDVTQYAIANGLADDYGPWINLTAANTAADDRHASEAPTDPVPNGASHGGDILLEFFETDAQGLIGSTFTKAPTFPQGAVTVGAVTLDGSLFQKAPTFPTGTITAGATALTGSLFQKAPTFPQGTVDATYPLTGSLFQHAPTFFAGAVTPGAVSIEGTLFSLAPTFPQGVVAAGAVVLLVVGDASNITAADQAIIDILEETASVTVDSDDDDARTSGFDLVVIAESCSSGTIAAKYDESTMPVVVMEQAISDEMRLSTDTSTAISTTQLVIDDDAHPLAAGFSGTVTILSSATNLHYRASVGTDVGNIGHPGGSGVAADKTYLYADTGDDLVTGTAPARRVWWGLGDGDGVTNATADMETLFRQMFWWASAGAVSTDQRLQALTGTTFLAAPTFPTGIVSYDQSITGSLFSLAPTFPVGTVTPEATALTGALFQLAPTFYTGFLGTLVVHPVGHVTAELVRRGFSTAEVVNDNRSL